MATQLLDGTGQGNLAKVNDENELVVRAINESELEHASSLGNAYIWTSGDQNIDSGDTMLFIKNTGDVPLILDRMAVIGSNVACTWTIHTGADVTTPAGGSVVTGINLNRIFASTAADALSRTDETAVADGDILSTFHTAATVQAAPIDLNGIILGKGHYIQVNQETTSTAGTVTIIGHFESPD